MDEEERERERERGAEEDWIIGFGKLKFRVPYSPSSCSKLV